MQQGLTQESAVNYLLQRGKVSKNQIDYDTWRQNEIELDDWRFLHYTTKQVKDNWTPYLNQIEQKIEQLGGLERPENFERKVGEEQGKYIVDGEEPL